ncbi:restriction endonuclease [Micromonospora tulbaghiae]|uniref:Restriction endonuclease n=1 Tax=Micromonospora tulbaghiae TaxID=479978 RepID=A0A386WY69_9ACTN|nr:restriction endonuclease [Micromonospora tulbaghiae]
MRFDGLNPTEFEEFCFDLMSDAGFTNVDWRKGTPKSSSPADRGRDIVATLEREDVDGYRFSERWFVDCKHYDRGVPPEALQGAITWAQAERPHTVLFIASGYLTNGAKDWIASFERGQPPFRIRTWELPQLRNLVAEHLDVAFRHDVSLSTLRRVSDILDAEASLVDALWYGRKPGHDQAVPAERPEEIVAKMRAAMRRMEEQYGAEELTKHTESDWAWGFLSGKISALRWVLGYEWDMLDS